MTSVCRFRDPLSPSVERGHLSVRGAIPKFVGYSADSACSSNGWGRRVYLKTPMKGNTDGSGDL